MQHYTIDPVYNFNYKKATAVFTFKKVNATFSLYQIWNFWKNLLYWNILWKNQYLKWNFTILILDSCQNMFQIWMVKRKFMRFIIYHNWFSGTTLGRLILADHFFSKFVWTNFREFDIFNYFTWINFRGYKYLLLYFCNVKTWKG